MWTPSGRTLFWTVPAGAVIAGLVYALWPRPVEVDLATVTRGPLAVTVAEEGQTRIRDVFVVSAPVRGRALRTDVEAGDAVIAGDTVVAEIEPIDPEFLDVRSEEEARAAAAAARAALALAGAELDQARAELDFATSELTRIRELAESSTVSARSLEEAERTFRIREAAVATAEAQVEMREYELRAAEARLLRPTEPGARGAGCPCIPIRSPVDGEVLRVLHESEGVVAAGQALVEVGDPRDLEVVADFRSEDAVRIEPGQRVIVDRWGGATALGGRVRRVEPFGFTKVSALGIEEQRVNVVIDITDPPETWRRLGHGFEVEARVVLWEAADALKLPLTALFRDGDRWQVFAVRDGRALVTSVEIGARTDTEAAVLSGLEKGDAVVRYPDERLADGTRVAERR